MSLQIRWIGGTGERWIGGVRVSPDVPFESADALLSSYRPDPELLFFGRTRAWHCTEAFTNRQWGGRKWSWRRVARRLAPEETLGHGAAREESWLPPLTHWWSLSVLSDGPRARRAVGIASNWGWNQLRRTPEIVARNRFLMSSLTDLYGRKRHWDRYREHLWSRRGPPSNYLGEPAGDASSQSKRNTMARYKVAIALENTVEPFYFTEKFIAAVEAGCIPVYHAHPTVAKRYLKEARWVDPADFDWDVDETLQFALDQRRDHYVEPNRSWLQGGILDETSYGAVEARCVQELIRRVHSGVV